MSVFNAASFIEATLRSLLAQEGVDLEALIFDDGSTDGTIELLRDASRRDARIRLFEQENRGCPRTRNRGIELATGEYIGFLDHDDVWHPEKLSLQARLLDRHSEVGLVSCWSRIVAPDRRRPSFVVGGGPRLGDASRAILEWDFVSGGSVALVRRSCFEKVGGFDPSLAARSDWDMWVRICRHFPVATVPRELVTYTRRPTGSSQSYDRLVLGGQAVIARAARHDRRISPQLMRRYQALDYMTIAFLAVTDGNPSAALSYVYRAARKDPSVILGGSRIRTALLALLSVLPAPLFGTVLKVASARGVGSRAPDA